MTHPLLKRQLKRFGGGLDSAPPEWSSFVAAIDEAYNQSDADRLLLERSLELTSKELGDRFEELLLKHKELAAVREAALDGIISVNAQGSITEFNHAAEQIF